MSSGRAVPRHCGGMAEYGTEGRSGDLERSGGIVQGKVTGKLSRFFGHMGQRIDKNNEELGQATIKDTGKTARHTFFASRQVIGIRECFVT